MKKRSLKPPAIAEIVFDILYLLFAIGAGIFLLIKSGGRTIVTLYGALSLTLGLGDAFHLLPRVYSLWTNTMDAHYKALGLGKLVTSLTMTVFYVMLYYVWRLVYSASPSPWLTFAVLLLAVIRIALCLLPQNGWFQKEPPYRFAIYRNLPFVLLGTVVAVLFAKGGAQGLHSRFRLLPLAILLSFLFYLAVVLFAGKHKKLGMLMLPKTITYIWMICMGFSLL